MYEKRQKVFIYQMGKVASSSIRLTLSQMGGVEAIQAHYLSNKHSKSMNEFKKSLGWKVIALDLDNVNRLYEILNAEARPKIITLVRDPISRNISAFFQSLDKIVGIDDAHAQLTLDELVEIFFNRYPHQIPLTWFDREFKEVLGVDIFEYPFPKDKGARVINQGKHEVLIMRYDLHDTEKAVCIEQFLGMKDVSIKNKNISKSKSYAEVYSKFKNHIKLPSCYITQMLDSKYSHHFYDKEELAAIKKLWT